jgi:hypothetical protein
LARTLFKENGGKIQLILTDIVEPVIFLDARIKSIKADLTNDHQLRALFETDFGIPDTIYCMHGIMSRGAEDSFELGLKVHETLMLCNLIQSTSD